MPAGGVPLDGAVDVQVQLRLFAEVRLEAGLAILADRRDEQLRQRVYRVDDVDEEHLDEDEAERGPPHVSPREQLYERGSKTACITTRAEACTASPDYVANARTNKVSASSDGRTNVANRHVTNVYV